MTRVIGLISGTSVDGIDAALVEIAGLETDLQVTLQAGATYPYPEDLRARILAVGSGASLSTAELADLDDAIAHQFAQAAQHLQQGHPPAHLIGSHGQTVFHRPPDPITRTLGYSLQLGRGEMIAHLTGIPTVSNFRVADIAVGGQGAPLVPRVDAYLFSHPTEHRCIQNIGGIGNVAYLPPQSEPGWEQRILGWDTGPGNMLIDLAVQHLSGGQQQYDRNGEWAAQGTPCQALVQQWLQQDFFQQPPPKSTGREQFGTDYLHQCLRDAASLTAADLLATLTDFTAVSIAHSYQTYLPHRPDRVFLCGGGSRNLYLKQRLALHLAPTVVLTTDDVGISSDFKEAIAFAVLAYWRTHQTPGNLPNVTGAKRSMLLGEFHAVPEGEA
jgi:anhydro-N-acetylmuramic acid kinase